MLHLLAALALAGEPPRGTLHVDVVDETGRPIEGAEVWLAVRGWWVGDGWQLGNRTGSNAWQPAPLDHDNHQPLLFTVKARAPGYVETFHGTVDFGEVTVQLDRRAVPVTGRVEGDLSDDGWVVTMRQGRGAAWGQSQAPVVDGRFTVDHVGPGACSLIVWRPGRSMKLPEWQPCTIGEQGAELVLDLGDFPDGT